MKRGIAILSLVAITMLSSGCNILHRGCRSCGGAFGCRPCSIGWQRGGTDYNRYLSQSSHHQLSGTGGPASGVQSAQVGYPYYTHRGPRDFLVNNPPSIGR